MTTGEIARLCGVSLPTVKKWIREGRLQAFRTPGGHYRVREGAFREFAQRMGLEPERGLAGGPGGAAAVLVVDDDPRFLELVTEVLRHPPGAYKVETAVDGYEALLRVGLSRPDVLILDLRMPDLDGLQVCRRIRSDPLLRETRILAVTGYGDEDTETAARAAGADEFLEKPIDLRALRARIAELLGRRARDARGR
jgi:excisionase family DNA binding protein